MTDLAELLKRVRSATGPDRELDAAVKIAAAAYMIVGGRSQQEVLAAAGGNLFDEAPAYSGSIDAALALTERALPRLMFNIHSHSGDGSQWQVMLTGEKFCMAELAPTLPLAILSATLSALIAQAKP